MQSSLNGRVLHIGKFYPPFRGGMEAFLADLIEEQRKQGLYVIGLVHGRPRTDDPSWLHRVPVQAKILYAPVGLSFPFALRRLIRQFEPDVLHLHMPNNAVFWALFMPLARGIPWVIHWQSDVVRSRIKRIIALAYSLVYEPFERAVLRHAERIIVSSPNYLAASATLRPWRSKTRLIPLGLRDETVNSCVPINADQTYWRPGKFRVLSLGRLTYYKGFETLIQAVAGLPDVELLIAGAGEMQGPLATLITSHTPTGQEPAIRLLGAVTEAEKHALLASCDVFCLASRERTESFGLAVVEAMQHAKPCIASDLPGSGLPWLVTQSGGGLLAGVEDVASWRTAIERLKADPVLRHKLGIAGRRAALGMFSIKACAEQVAALYAGILPEVFFNAPIHDRLNLILVRAEESVPRAQATLRALKQAGWRNFLLLGCNKHKPALDAMADDSVTVLTPALQLSDWNDIQAGIRFALRNGYRSVLTVCTDAGSSPQAAIDLVQAQTVHLSEPDLLIGTPSHAGKRLPPTRLLDHWVMQLTGVSLKTLESRLRLYQHDAMVIASSREATLLDHDDIGALLLMKKARLHITEVAVQSSGMARISLRRIFTNIIALALFRFSSWSIRHRPSSMGHIRDSA